MRVLVFGDSNTQGFWDTEGGWVQRIRSDYDRKAVQNIAGRYFATFFNLGISGDKSDSILRRMESEIEARKWPDEEFVLVFAFGANNSYVKNGQPHSSVKEFKTDIQEIIGIAKKHATRIIFVGPTNCDEARTKPVFWDDVVWENTRLKQFDDALQKLCQKEDVVFIPVFEKFQQEQEKRNLLEDGIHPNNKGHQFLADLIQPTLDQILKA